MSTYGAAGVTYAVTGTYGSWGATETPSTPAGGFRAHGYRQRKRIPGFGHLDVTVYLHGEPGPTVTLDGEGRTRSAATLTADTATSARMKATTDLFSFAASLRGQGQLTPTLAAELSQIKDPADLWLLLDLPELA